LVVYLDDEIYKRFKMMCVIEEKSLKDKAYEILKDMVESYKGFSKTQPKKKRIGDSENRPGIP
jgi:hypothetical protein